MKPTMSRVLNVFLLLAVLVCVSKAQLDHQSGRCLCNRTHNKIRSMSDIQEVKIYKANIFCNRLEIVVITKRRPRYCLNPQLDAMQKLLSNIMKSEIHQSPIN